MSPDGPAAWAAVRGWPAQHPRQWLALRWALGLALLVVLVRLVADRSGELRSAGSTLAGLNPWWIAPAVAAELSSYVLFASAQRVVLAGGGARVGLIQMTGIALAGQATSSVLPGGVAVSSTVIYRQLRRRGVPDGLTGWMLVVNALLYGGALAVLAVVGALIAGPSSPIPDLGLIAAAVVGALALIAVGLALVRRRLSAVAGVLGRLAHVQLAPPRLAVAFALLAASWLASAGTLLAAFAAVHVSPPGSGLLIAYCAGQLAASLPIVPGGLGLAEGSLTVALVAFGGPEAGTLAAVLVYRLVAYWGLLPTGAAAYLLLRRRRPV